MKLKGKYNIITEDDITLNDGTSLSDKLQNLQSDIDGLKSNVKWIYKYGGVGSGSGGTGGGSSDTSASFTISASLDGRPVTSGETLTIAEAGSHTLHIKILKPAGLTYKVSYQYGMKGTNGTVSTVRPSSVTLNLDNNYEADLVLRLNCNDELSLTASNGDYEKYFVMKYMAIPYEFNFSLVDSNLSTVTQSQLYIETYRDNKLSACIEYSVTTEAAVTYNVQYDGTWIYDSYQVIDLSGARDGKIYIELPEEYDTNNPGDRDLYIAVNVYPTGSDMVVVPYTRTLSLIPKSLYVAVSVPTGRIYTSEQEDAVLYNPGYVTINATVYDDYEDKGYSYSVYAIVDEGTDNESTHIITCKWVDTTSFNDITLYTPGKHTIKISCNSGDQPYEKVYYVYIAATDTSINWYQDSLLTNTNSLKLNYYRQGESTDNFSSVTSPMLYSTVLNDATFLLEIPTMVSAGTYFDVNFAFGIQYSAINDESNTILEAFGSTGTTAQVTVSQKSMTVLNNTLSWFLPTEDSMDITNSSKYHLVNIYLHYVKTDSNKAYYDIYLYVDGKLEASTQANISEVLRPTSVHFNNINYDINLFEVSYLLNDPNAAEDSKLELVDAVVLRYYSKYKNVYLMADVKEDLQMLSILKEFNVADNAVTCSLAAILNLASIAGVPVMILSSEETESNNNVMSFLTSIDTGINKNRTIPVTIQWSANGSAPKDVVYSTDNVKFSILIQGTSSLGYKGKNFTLAAEPLNLDSESNEVITLFSPNFDSSDSTTFLPETEFTLKKDVVDSSHSNNTAVGKFVNEVTTKFNTGSTSLKYNSYIKNCLDGFKFVMFFALTSGGETTYYYFGIYNFNLGRGSNMNLGYVNPVIFENSDYAPRESDDVWSIVTLPKNAISTLSGFVVAEVQDNKKQWDFSLYDSTVLFKDKTKNSSDNDYMFGDMKYGKTEAEAEVSIANFVKKIAQAGHYIFKYIGKDFGPYTNAYQRTDDYGPLNEVPDNSIQYTRAWTGGSSSFTEKETILTDEEDFTEANFLETISGNESEGTVPALNLQSAVEYYTTCMALGLVDSVQKNLNIKTWSAGNSSGTTYYLAFYDMDTSLGIANDGTATSHVAFSDHNQQKYQVIDDVYYADLIETFRDYSPQGKLADGSNYDTPSSYLFALAKYANLIDDSVMSPKQLWALWRGANVNSSTHEGCLINADAFVDKYYAGDLLKIHPVLINLNYRNTYFVYQEDSHSYENENFKKFQGTRIEYVRDWLSKRFHILDMFFDITTLGSDAILIRNNSTGEWVNEDGLLDSGNAGKTIRMFPALETSADLTNNPDIIIYKDLFLAVNATTEHKGTGTITFKFSSPDYSPLCFIYPQSRDKLITDTNVWQLTVQTDGNLAFNCGGSREWTYLENINSYMEVMGLAGVSTYITSSKLTNIFGTSGKCGGFIINDPAVLSITLTSPNYVGTLQLSTSNGLSVSLAYSTLEYINIGGSGLSFEGSDMNIKTFIANDLNATKLTLSQCNLIETLNLNNVTLSGELSLSGNGAGMQNLTLSNLSTGSVTAHYTGTGKSSITIQNNSTLTTVSLQGYDSVTINNCPNLTKIVYTEGKDHTLTSFALTNTGTTLLTFNDSKTAGTLDLTSYTGLSRISLFSNKLVNNLKINSEVSVGINAFNATVLSYIDTSDDGAIIINNTGTNSVFKDSSYFTCAKSSSNSNCPNIRLGSNVTNISNLFASTAINLSQLNKFIDQLTDEECSRLTNISGFIRECGSIYYTSQQLLNDIISNYTSGPYSCTGPHFYRFTNATLCGEIWGTGITAWHKGMIYKPANGSQPAYGLAMNVDTTSIGCYSGANYCAFLYGLFDPVTNSDGDVIYDIASKFNSNFGKVHTGTTDAISLSIYDLDSSDESNVKATRLTSYKFSDIFPKMPNLDYFCTTAFPSTDLVDFTDAFSGWDNLKIIHGVCNNCTGAINIGGLLKPLSNLYRIVSSFDGLGGSSEIVDWYNFIDWPKFISNSAKLKSSGGIFWLDNGMPMNFTKTITYNDIQKILSYVNSYSILNMDYLFVKCIITGLGTNTFTAPFTSERSVTSMKYTFYGVTNMDNNKTYPITLDPHILKYLTKCTDFTAAFSNMYLDLSIPLDFFGRHYSTDTTVYHKVDDDYVEGTLHVNYYTLDITTLTSMFSGTKWYNGTGDGSGRSSNHYDGSVVGDEIHENSVSVYTRNRLTVTIDDVTTYYYSDSEGTDGKYYTRTGSEGFYSYREANIPFDTVYYDINYKTYDSDGNLYVEPVYDDNHYFGPTYNTLCLAPDFFYACTGGAAVIGTFYNAYTTFNKAGIYSSKILSLAGYLPKYLFKNIASSIENTLTGIIVLPRLFKHEYVDVYDEDSGETNSIAHYYLLFIPNEFYTKVNSLPNAFMFYINILPDTLTEVRHYFIMNLNSVSNSLTYLVNSLPTRIGGFIPSSQTGYNGTTHLNIMYNLDSEGNVIEGINKNNKVLNNLYLDGILESIYLLICLSGNLFAPGYTLTKAFTLEEDGSVSSSNAMIKLSSLDFKFPSDLILPAGNGNTKYLFSIIANGRIDLKISLIENGSSTYSYYSNIDRVYVS